MRNGAIYSYLWSSVCTICTFVAVNALTPFLLEYTKDAHNVASIAGNLVLVDELMAMPMVLVWGWLVDRVSLRFVATAGHTLTALALVLLPQPKTVYPGLLLARMFTSLGHSALTLIFTAAISLLSHSTEKKESNEAEPLLVDQPTKKRDESARLSGYVGFASGCGALLAVFVFLRLPPYLAPDSTKGGLHSGLKHTFYLNAALELSAAVVCYWKLRPTVERVELRFSFKDEINRLVKGFQLIRHDAELAVASVSGMTARAATIVAALFIPLYVARYFAQSGRCDMDPNAPPTKEGCREAYILSSTLTGVVQLVTLICSVIIGAIGSWKTSTSWQPAVLAVSYAIGSIGWLIWAFLPSHDPTNFALSIPSSILLGFSQIAGVVLSLSMVARARGRLTAEGAGQEGDVSGAIAGAYSFLGSVAILVVSQTSGLLTDKWQGSAFLMMAAFYLALAGVAGVFSIRSKSKK